MNYCFYAFISLILIVSRTAYLPTGSITGNFFDPMAIMTVYLAIFKPIRESIIVTSMTGIIVDILSGGPFGLYFTAYILLYVCVKWVMTYLQVRNIVLILLIILMSVLFENILILISLAMIEKTMYFSPWVLKKIIEQLIWALIIGPVFIFFIKYCQDKWNNWCTEIMAGIKDEKK